MHKIILFAGACAAAISIAGSASAVIVSGTSTNRTFVKLEPGFTELTPDNTVGNNNFNINKNFYGFDEDQNIILASDREIQTSKDGNTFTTTTLAAGTVIASHYIFYDPKSNNGTPDVKNATVTFDSDILGFAATDDFLVNTDFLANTGVNYITKTNGKALTRGLEKGDELSFLGTVLSLDWSSGTPGDYVRVFTAVSPGGGDPKPEVVPLPATLPLLITGLAGVGFLSRRRKAA